MTRLTEECEEIHKREVKRAYLKALPIEFGVTIAVQQANKYYYETFCKSEDEIDAKEIEIIKQCATESTSNASAFAEGYKAGYERALELVRYGMNKWIDDKRKNIINL